MIVVWKTQYYKDMNFLLDLAQSQEFFLGFLKKLTGWFE